MIQQEDKVMMFGIKDLLNKVHYWKGRGWNDRG